MCKETLVFKQIGCISEDLHNPTRNLSSERLNWPSVCSSPKLYEILKRINNYTNKTRDQQSKDLEIT